ncbi:MAG TPA: hypothetical protein DCY27_10395 [Desulfobacterales bacterium]|nr:hypothetical protein [Desulfobacterales bacterium]
MRKLILLIPLLLLALPASLLAAPLACKQVGPDKVDLGQNRLITLAAGLEIEKISEVACESRELNGVKFLIARYTVITGPGADGKNRAKRLYQEYFVGDDDIISVFGDELNETGVDQPFRRPGSKSELVACEGSIFIVGFEEKSLKDYFRAVAQEKAGESSINAFAVHKFYPGKKPCPRDDESCKPRFVLEDDPALIARILQSMK